MARRDWNVGELGTLPGPGTRTADEPEDRQEQDTQPAFDGGTKPALDAPDDPAPAEPAAAAPAPAAKARRARPAKATAKAAPDAPAEERTAQGSHLAEVLAAGGDVDLYLARHRPRRGASVPSTYRIPLDLRELLDAWVDQAPRTRTATGLLVALIDAWARDSELPVDTTPSERDRT